MAKDEAFIDEETIRKCMELRSYLETKMKELEDEQDKLRTLFKILDEVIVNRSFRRAEATPLPATEQPKPVPPPPPEPRPYEASPSSEEIPLRSQGGLLLANMYVSAGEAQIVPAPGIVFTVSTPPFQSFLIGRIFEPMRQRDLDDVRSGALTPDKALEYEVVREGEIIRRIVVRNYGDQRRIREIMTTTRWTLEKMSQKAGSNP